jgi:hypothetical protein
MQLITGIKLYFLRSNERNRRKRSQLGTIQWAKILSCNFFFINLIFVLFGVLIKEFWKFEAVKQKKQPKSANILATFIIKSFLKFENRGIDADPIISKRWWRTSQRSTKK